MTTTTILDNLEQLTAEDLQGVLDRLERQQRLVKGLLAARVRIDAEARRFAEWDAEEEQRQRSRTGQAK